MDDEFYDDEGYEPVGGGAPKRGKPNHVVKTVEAILDEEDLISDAHGIVWRYDSRRWEQLTVPQRHKLALDYGGKAATARRIRTEIADLLALRVQRKRIDWGKVITHEISCRSGMLDLRSGETREHRREDYLEAVLPWDYDPAARCDVWIEALETYFGSADDSRAIALQEFAGYVIMPHAKFKKACLLFGPGDTGKSEVIWLFEQLVGREQCCSLPVEDMDDPVRRSVIKGKQLNRTGEISASALIKDGGFKLMVSTGEPIMIDQKYEHAHMYEPFAKHVFGSNALPRIRGRTEEVFNRLLIVAFDKILTEAEQDREHQTKLAAEMDGIFAWAVRGAQALYEQGGRFTEPGGRAAILAEWRREQDPVLDWLGEVLKPADGWRLPVSEVARSASDALKRTVTPHEIGKAVRALGYETDSVYHKALKRTTRCILDMGIEAPVGMQARDMEGSGMDEIPP